MKKQILLTLACGATLAAGTLLSQLAVADAPKATLPFVVYEEAGKSSPYIPSGYMGNTGAIKLTDSTENPHSGKSCLKAQYTAANDWGGLVWQSPANDWGEQAGGINLTGAKKLTFWARGAQGEEEVTFLFGLIGKDKKYPDSGSGKLDKVKLTSDWKQYEIDLKDVDLSQIKTGFAWVLGAAGQPVTFYLDDIKYE